MYYDRHDNGINFAEEAVFQMEVDEEIQHEVKTEDVKTEVKIEHETGTKCIGESGQF